jgi:hypothetical protein
MLFIFSFCSEKFLFDTPIIEKVDIAKSSFLSVHNSTKQARFWVLFFVILFIIMFSSVISEDFRIHMLLWKMESKKLKI